MIRLKSLLNEQKADQLMPGQPDNPTFTGKVKAKQTAADLMKGVEAAKETKLDTHNAMLAASIVTAFIPVVGPILSAGIALGDAAVYASEGDDYMAGLTGLFAAMPLIGPIARIGSGAIAKLGAKQMSKLGMKVSLASKGGKVQLTQLEAQAVRDLAKNNKFIRLELDKWLTAQAKQHSKQLSAWTMRKGAMSAATRQALKNPLTKFAATLGLYMGAGTVYDAAYYKLNCVTPKEFYAAIQAEEERVMKQTISELDQIIAAKRGKVSRTETVHSEKSELSEAMPVQPAADIFSSLGSIPLSWTVYGAIAVGSWFVLRNILKKLGAESAAAGKKGESMRWLRYAYRWLKLSWGTGARDRALLNQEFSKKGQGLFISKDDYIKIIADGGRAALEYNIELIKAVENLYETPEAALKKIQNQVSGQIFDKYKDLVDRRLKALADNTQPTATSTTTNTAKDFIFNPDYVPRNMSIDDYNKLTFNTRATIQKTHPEWTYDQALKWQKSH